MRDASRPSGWLIVDKPGGMTSAAVVARIKRLAGGAKVGHGGTLDPLATGVLPIAVGEATKTVAYAMAGAKRYAVRASWGEARDTDDAEGRVVETSDARPSADDLRAALGAFRGAIMQLPPDYSAIKVAGKRAYALARGGTRPALAPREIHVARFALTACAGDWAAFEIECGKGTYVRALVRDLARAVGTVGHVAALRRTAVGPFSDKHAIPLDNLTGVGHSLALVESMLPVESALVDIPALTLTACAADRLRHGQTVSVPAEDAGTVYVMADARLVALAEINGGQLCPVRIFNL